MSAAAPSPHVFDVSVAFTWKVPISVPGSCASPEPSPRSSAHPAVHSVTNATSPTLAIIRPPYQPPHRRAKNPPPAWNQNRDRQGAVRSTSPPAKPAQPPRAQMKNGPGDIFTRPVPGLFTGGL